MTDRRTTMTRSFRPGTGPSLASRREVDPGRAAMTGGPSPQSRRVVAGRRAVAPVRHPRPRRVPVVACLGLVALVALAVCKRDQAAQQPPPPPPVQLAPADVSAARTATIETGPLVSGTLEAARSATVRAQLGGTVLRIGPEIGQAVAENALLAEIDPRGLGVATASARAQLASAQAQLELARREVERSQALVEAGAVARRDLETAQSRVAAQQAALDQARAQLATASRQLDQATVRSPMAGVVAQRAVSTGDVVTPGATLYQVIDPSSIRLSASVPSDQLGALATGQAVRFTVHGYPDETFTGQISRIAPSADPTTKQIAILAEMPNPSRRLLVGLLARGRIASQRATGVVIPVAAIDTRTTPPAVLRVSGGTGSGATASGPTIERVPVKLGLRDPLRDEVIVTGIAPGDRIVARAAAAPPPGSRVALAPSS
jgi:RND family efflux transporter MFP subunit